MMMAYWSALMNSHNLSYSKTALEAHSCAFPHNWAYPIFERIFPCWSASKFGIFAEWHRSNGKTFSALNTEFKWIKNNFSKSTVFAEGCIFHHVSHRIKNSARKDELVGCAVEASTAYDNIINAIKVAEEAANKAGNAADSALSVSTCKWLNDDIFFFLNYQRGAKKWPVCSGMPYLSVAILWTVVLHVHELVLVQH